MDISLNYREKMLRCIEDWRKKLLDLTRKNPLISLKFGKTATSLLLKYPTSEVIWGRLFDHQEAMNFCWKDILLEKNLEEIEQVESVLKDVATTPNDAETEQNTDAAQNVADTAIHGAKPSERDATTEQTKADEWQQLLSAPKLQSTHLLTEFPDTLLRSKLRKLSNRAKESLSEQGVQTLYLACGLLKWREAPNSNVWMKSPLLLIPARLEQRTPGCPWNLSLIEDEIVPNQSLAEMLQNDFAVELPPLPDFAPDLDSNTNQASSSVTIWRNWLASIRMVLRKQSTCEKWEVTEEIGLGLFRFQKLPIWHDLGCHQDQIAAHPVCRALSGDTTAMANFSPDIRVLDNENTDQTVHPEQLYTILDSDSSQLKAILAAKSGASLVLDGPPGTGKSQTIANIIAQTIADGKRVLFVSEKRAALEVVQSRLNERRLGDFCLNCHQVQGNGERQTIYDEIKRCMELLQEKWEDSSQSMQQLFQLREQLNQYVHVLHQPYGAMGRSPWQVHGKLTKLHRQYPQIRSRFRIDVPLQMTSEGYQERLNLLRRIGPFQEMVDQQATHPWRACVATAEAKYTASREIEAAFLRLLGQFHETEPALCVLQKVQILPEEPTLSECRRAVDTIRESKGLPIFPERWFTTEPSQVIRLLASIREERQKTQRRTAKLATLFPHERLENPQLAETWRSLQQTLQEPFFTRLRWNTVSSPTLRGLCHFLENVFSLAQKTSEQIVQTRALLSQMLQSLGFPESLVPHFGQIALICKLAKQISEIPIVPKNWFQAEKMRLKEILEILKSMEQLHDQLDTIWNTSSIRDCFSRGSWYEIEPYEIENLALVLARAKEQSVGLEQRHEELSAYLRLVPDLWSPLVETQWEEVGEKIRLAQEEREELDRLHTYCSTMACIPASWSQMTLKRAIEIRNSLEEFERRQEQLTQAQKLLSTRLTSAAFEEIGAVLVGRFIVFRSFWKRLFGGWKPFCTEAIAQLYQPNIPVPSPNVVRSDMEELSTFHASTVKIRTTIAEYLYANHDTVPSESTIRQDLEQLQTFLSLYITYCTKNSILYITSQTSGNADTIRTDIEKVATFLSQRHQFRTELMTQLYPSVSKTEKPCGQIDDPQIKKFLNLLGEFHTMVRNVSEGQDEQNDGLALFFPKRYEEFRVGIDRIWRVTATLGGTFPKFLASRLSTPNGLDRKALEAWSVQLAADHERSRAYLTQLLGGIRLAKDATVDELQHQSPSALCELVMACQNELAKYHSSLDHFPMLRSDQDVEIRDLPEIQKELDELLSVRTECLNLEQMYMSQYAQEPLFTTETHELEPSLPSTALFAEPVVLETQRPTNTWDALFEMADQLIPMIRQYPQFLRSPKSPLVRYLT
ncbi:MAG: DUF4011 domain-containing protein [Thermoguttaceae bacterium]|nr:DUF4011 domain-containing protein [Thermoguttaceae bacterium]